MKYYNRVQRAMLCIGAGLVAFFESLIGFGLLYQQNNPIIVGFGIGIGGLAVATVWVAYREITREGE